MYITLASLIFAKYKSFQLQSKMIKNDKFFNFKNKIRTSLNKKIAKTKPKL